jgi:hypothetical protein
MMTETDAFAPDLVPGEEIPGSDTVKTMALS